jgi:GNAT superfamily N-acetyltransferase
MAPCTAIETTSELYVRQVTADDRDLLARMFDHMSDESRRLRFFALKPRLTERELTYLTDIDHVRHDALAAFDETGQMIGVARYVQGDEAGTVEIAASVADPYQGRGIGRMLLSAVSGAATRARWPPRCGRTRARGGW